jgi:hypothetical protein
MVMLSGIPLLVARVVSEFEGLGAVGEMEEDELKEDGTKAS